MRVLIIGSLAGELGQAARMAIARGAKLDQADDAEAGLVRLRGDARVDVVLCDLRHDVGALVATMAAERITTPVVACGVNPDAEAAVRAMRQGAREFLPLPPDPELIAAILEAASGEQHTLVVRDPAMQACLHRAAQVATSDASVLIVGESGTGKEVLARHVHRRSRRAGGPFVALNCAAIPDNLLESELFGHEKGAFSGAVARRIGKFEAAEGGTLLLDEISEMDVLLQAKLLRALQEREIEPLGSNKVVPFDARVIAATSRDLAALVREGKFREDLYYRLNVLPIKVPPLRERGPDIGALPEVLIEDIAMRNGTAPFELDPAAISLLSSQRWRGNTRELRNVLEQAAMRSDSQQIDERVLVGVLRDAGIERLPPAPPPQRAGSAANPNALRPLAEQVAEVERQAIQAALAATGGNKLAAARLLGISRAKLYERLELVA
jgi:two-component system, response regulator FlrC